MKEGRQEMIVVKSLLCILVTFAIFIIINFMKSVITRVGELEDLVCQFMIEIDDLKKR